MRAIIEWLCALFEPPCFHEWEKIAELRDRPNNPTAATILRMCRLCGELDERTIKAPEGSAPQPRCPPHKWETVHRINIYRDGGGPDVKGSFPIGNSYILKCIYCGDLTRKNLYSGRPTDGS